MLSRACHQPGRGSRAKTLRTVWECRATAGDRVDQVIASANGLVNATPVGMAKYPGMPVAAQLLREELGVADIVYFPLETELLRAARALGCRTMSGGGMAGGSSTVAMPQIAAAALANICGAWYRVHQTKRARRAVFRRL